MRYKPEFLFIIILYFVVFFVISCSNNIYEHSDQYEEAYEENDHYIRKIYNEYIDGAWFSIYEIDSCEYIYQYGETLLHKQNCKFCKEREKK